MAKISALFFLLFIFCCNISCTTHRYEKPVYKTADSLDRQHPLGFFTTTAKLMGEGRKDDAAFLYYLGQLRYRYYNAANPDYLPGNDGALFASFENMLSQPVETYLRADINKYIGTLNEVIAWDSLHDYQFFPETKSPDTHREIVDKLKEMRDELNNNREKYTGLWVQQQRTTDSLMKIADSIMKPNPPAQ